jgi:hypothetical protein
MHYRYNRCSGTLASQATVGHARALSGTPMYSRFGLQADEIHSAAAEYNKFRASMQVPLPSVACGPLGADPLRRLCLRRFGSFTPRPNAAAVGRSPEDQRSRNGARARDGCAQEAGRSLTSLPSAHPNPQSPSHAGAVFTKCRFWPKPSTPHAAAEWCGVWCHRLVSQQVRAFTPEWWTVQGRDVAAQLEAMKEGHGKWAQELEELRQQCSEKETFIARHPRVRTPARASSPRCISHGIQAGVAGRHGGCALAARMTASRQHGPSPGADVGGRLRSERCAVADSAVHRCEREIAKLRQLENDSNKAVRLTLVYSARERVYRSPRVVMHTGPGEAHEARDAQRDAQGTGG